MHPNVISLLSSFASEHCYNQPPQTRSKNTHVCHALPFECGNPTQAAVTCTCHMQPSFGPVTCPRFGSLAWAWIGLTKLFVERAKPGAIMCDNESCCCAVVHKPHTRGLQLQAELGSFSCLQASSSCARAAAVCGPSSTNCRVGPGPPPRRHACPLTTVPTRGTRS